MPLTDGRQKEKKPGKIPAMGAEGTERSRDLPGKSDISRESGAQSGARGELSTSADALTTWLDACPIVLQPDARKGIMDIIRASAPGQDT